MVSISISRKPLESQEVDGLAVFLTEGFSVENDLSALASSYFPALKELIAQKEFTGKSLSSLIVTGFKRNKAIDLIFVGLGKASDNGSIETEIYRRAVGRVIRIA